MADPRLDEIRAYVENLERAQRDINDNNERLHNQVAIRSSLMALQRAEDLAADARAQLRVPDDFRYLLARLEKAEAVVEAAREVAKGEPGFFYSPLRAALAAYDEARDG